MAGLKLKLRPDEQILINGSVIQNGSKQVELTVKTLGTRILRLRDALHPDEITTPVKRVCYVAQLAVAGEVTDEDAHRDFIKGINALQKIFKDEGSQVTMEKAISQADEGDFYKAMQSIRKLIPYEEALFAKMAATEVAVAPEYDMSDTAHNLASLSEKLLGSNKELHN